MAQDQALPPIMSYFCLHYPTETLSKARLTKLVYLADWYSALVDGQQLTNINWIFNHYGPYVEDVVNIAKSNEHFYIDEHFTPYGTPKNVIRYDQSEPQADIDPKIQSILDYVIDNTKDLFFNQFIDLVYSTYPVKSQNRYTNLDLVTLSQEAKQECANP